MEVAVDDPARLGHHSATIIALQATRRLMSDTNSFSATGDIAETTAFERYGVKTSEKVICIISTGLPRPGLATITRRRV